MLLSGTGEAGKNLGRAEFAGSSVVAAGGGVAL